MSLFYVLAALILTAGFIAGYRIGIIKLLKGVFITAVALCSSCYLFIVSYSLLTEWFDLSKTWIVIIALCILFGLTTGFLIVILRFLPASFSSANKKLTGRLSGGITATVLSTLLFVAVITVTDVLNVPDNINEQLEETGVTGFITTSSQSVLRKLFPAEKKNTETMLAATSTKAITEEKNTRLPFFTNDYIIRYDLEKQMLELINGERITKGLQPLAADSALTIVARKHTADMFAKGYFSHNTPTGITPFNRLHAAKIIYLYAGENLAFSSTLLKAHEGLMLSPGHRANILNRQYHKVGIGILENKLYGLLITQEFKD